MNKKAFAMDYRIILFVIVIGIFIYFGLGGTGSFVDVQGVPLETQNIQWNGYNTDLTSVTFSSLSSGPGRQICGENDDPKISLENTYSNGNILNLYSKISSSYSQCGPNGISAEIDLPAGELTLSCDLKASSSKMSYDGSVALCSLDDIEKKLYTDDTNQNLNKKETITLKITEPKKVKVVLKTSASANGGSSSVNSDLVFISSASSTTSTTIPSTTSPGTTSPSVVNVNESFSDKINNFIDSIIDWIKSIFN